MASKFVEMNEAADLLGMTADDLNEARSAGEIHGYRDGASWKFKMDEVQRFAEERGVDLSSGGSSSAKPAKPQPADDDDFDELISIADEDDDSDDSASILVSEESLGHSGETTSSTVIGKEGEPTTDEDSDIKLADDELELASDEDLAKPAATPKPAAAATPSIPKDDDSAALGLADLGLDEGKLAKPAAKPTPAPKKEEEPAAAEEDEELALSLEGEDDFALSDEDLMLATDEEPRKASGSDLTLGSGDSGINLNSPSDSGLSLEEEPLDLGGPGGDASLELPSEEEDLIAFEEEGESDDIADLQQDEEFQLGPTDEMAIDESDSGSQVIALEESDDFESSDPVVATAEPDLLEAEEDLGAFDEGPADIPVGVPTMAPVSSGEAPQAEYTVWNVVGLLMIVLLLAVSGLLMMDVVRNMWTWNEPFSVSSSLAETLAGLLE